MKNYTIAKYLRLSLDDAVTESLSLPNQRALLDRHIEDMNIPGATILEFVDNGHSGTNFERPAVQEMLELVRGGGVDCILCKDFSRFGRNSIETGYFIEQVFPLYRIRFISVGDNFDSDNYKNDTGGIDVAFKFIMHEYYSKDLSKKVKSAKRIKMQCGESIVANAIYGYQKNDDGKWGIDEGAAPVVRQMFELALEDQKPAQIRDTFFEARIPTPREYISIKRGKGVTPVCMWTARMVTHMLGNEQYTGTYISGKQVSKAIGSHSKMNMDRSHWIILPDRHPGIVSKEVFQAVQEKMEKYRKGKIQRKPREFLLRGKVACGCCGYALSYDAIDEPVFRCHHTHADPSAECHKMKVNVRELDTMVMELIQKQVQAVIGSENLDAVATSGAREQKVAECEHRIRQCTEERQRIYEGFIRREIERDEYIMQKNECAARLDKLNGQLALMKAAEKSGRNRLSDITATKKIVRKSATPREMVEALVEKVLVFPGSRIEVRWLISDFMTKDGEQLNESV